jgi:hypothetical protein
MKRILLFLSFLFTSRQIFGVELSGMSFVKLIFAFNKNTKAKAKICILSDELIWIEWRFSLY